LVIAIGMELKGKEKTEIAIEEDKAVVY